jgi:hypothetical protein
MTVKLNRRAYDHARILAKEDKVVIDERDACRWTTKCSRTGK